MGVTVQDLIGQSSLAYEEGFILDPNFFKKAISKDRYQAVVGKQELIKGRELEGSLAIIWTVVSVVFFAMPAFIMISPFNGNDMYRGAVFSIAFLAGLINGIASEHLAYLNGEENKDDYLKKLSQRANLVACLSEEERGFYGFRKFESILVAMFTGSVFTVTQAFENEFLGCVTLICVGYSLGNKVSSLATSAMKNYLPYFQTIPA